MGYDAAKRIFFPDFQADDRLPQWINMDDPDRAENGDDEAANLGQGTGGFAKLLKQRMSRPKAPDVKLSPPDVQNIGEPAIPDPNPLYGVRPGNDLGSTASPLTKLKGFGGASSGGGMQSL